MFLSTSTFPCRSMSQRTRLTVVKWQRRLGNPGSQPCTCVNNTRVEAVHLQFRGIRVLGDQLHRQCTGVLGEAVVGHEMRHNVVLLPKLMNALRRDVDEVLPTQKRSAILYPAPHHTTNLHPAGISKAQTHLRPVAALLRERLGKHQRPMDVRVEPRPDGLGPDIEW